MIIYGDGYDEKAGYPRTQAALGPHLSILQRAFVLLATVCLPMATVIDARNFGLPTTPHARGLHGLGLPAALCAQSLHGPKFSRFSTEFTPLLPDLRAPAGCPEMRAPAGLPEIQCRGRLRHLSTARRQCGPGTSTVSRDVHGGVGALGAKVAHGGSVHTLRDFLRENTLP